ncbi:SDR family oxidoreductase [Oxalobacteraceae bacterium]|nr:SDR family oxidoreductase [Oxalobacteraceae bacterium]
MKDIFQANLLAGKAAFITGGGSGINQCIAERYAAAGAAVAIVGRDLAKAERAAAHIVALGGQAIGLSADVRDYDQVRAAMAQTHKRFGRLDIVVAGAAGNFVANAKDMSAKGFRTVVDIDLVGSFNTAHAAYDYLSKPGGLVVAISAVQGSMPMRTQSHVCAAKAGVDMLMRSLAIEWGSVGIRCVGIAPGPVGDTEGMRRLAPDGERSWERLLRHIPAGRAGQREEIAALALFLASGAADYINGVVLPIDGGQTAVGSYEFGAMLQDSLQSDQAAGGAA